MLIYLALASNDPDMHRLPASAYNEDSKNGIHSAP